MSCDPSLLPQDEPRTNWTISFGCDSLKPQEPKLRFAFPPQKCSRVHFKQVVQKATRTGSRAQSRWLFCQHGCKWTAQLQQWLPHVLGGVHWDTPLGHRGGTGALCSSALRQKASLTTCKLWCFPGVLSQARQSCSSLTGDWSCPRFWGLCWWGLAAKPECQTVS